MPFPADLTEVACALSGLNLDNSFFLRASELIDELMRWNQRIRLVGHRDERTAYIDLILDGLALVPHLRGNTILDIGSGAGFPGLALSLALPENHLTMIEGRSKKVSFQKHAIRILGISGNTESVLGRAGEGALKGRLFDNVTLRAVSDLGSCLSLAAPFAAPEGLIILPRSKSDLAQCLQAGLSVSEYLLPDRPEPRLIAISN